jgi:hypothetical protein
MDNLKQKVVSLSFFSYKERNEKALNLTHFVFLFSLSLLAKHISLENFRKFYFAQLQFNPSTLQKSGDCNIYVRS